jgi:hypothetical protein
MREKVELLEDHPGLGPDEIHVRTLIREVLSVHDNPTTGDVLEAIDAPEQCALSGSARAYDDHHFPGLNMKIDPMKHFLFAKPFDEIFNAYHRSPAYVPRPSR